MPRANKIYWSLAAVFLISAVFFVLLYNKSSTNLFISAYFNGASASQTLEVVDTPQARARGLGGRQELPDTHGMLFNFDSPDTHSIWMKDMLIDIDILWLNQDKEIIYLKDNASKDSYPEVYRPEIPASYVIELNDSAIERLGIRQGQKVDFAI